MKKIITSILIAITYSCAHAQDKYMAYCDINCYGTTNLFSNSALLSFDFGLNNQVDLLDDNGDKLKFSSYIDAANYLAKHGWKILQVFSYSDKTMAALVGKDSNPNIIHCVLVKSVSTDEEILQGLKTSKVKEPKKKQPRQSLFGG